MFVHEALPKGRAGSERRWNDRARALKCDLCRASAFGQENNTIGRSTSWRQLNAVRTPVKLGKAR